MLFFLSATLAKLWNVQFRQCIYVYKYIFNVLWCDSSSTYYVYTYIYITYNVPLLTSVDVVPLMKTAGVVENSGHCIYSIGLMCF